MKKQKSITTELQNDKTENLDIISVSQMIEKINHEDMQAVKAVGSAKKDIEKVIKKTAKAFASGGKIIFLGAGTSGRLGVLEAAECPPTFSSDPKQIIALIAGGKDAVFFSKEGAEDDAEQGKKDILKVLSKKDIVIGIAASGRTPYVLGALKEAKKKKVPTVMITCNPNAVKLADIMVKLPTGAEVLQGSTRMKAGSATKMALNIITTCTMVLCGKVYKNLMVDVNPSNIKLKKRARGLVQKVGQVDEQTAEILLEQAQYKVKPAIVMAQKRVGFKKAQAELKRKKGFLRKILNG
ncbi:Glucokinase regulatory-like protein [Elusimicrobium minutum Pei191]|uniref:N-acetylmuramic acid 6-phosphate etherase n=1 Tax=Elusimicrobium minutum (strain Pei191) TaxID=445932 RepID=B2KEY0_ELUMP|nr:N-acetylmuramic acid 6-phosphate etherase [Elusimicrobium minutum]ACC99076.1 Glucokinase regulatory-like protein [Elusimicrobium minutum Pei191]